MKKENESLFNQLNIVSDTYHTPTKKKNNKKVNDDIINFKNSTKYIVIINTLKSIIDDDSKILYLSFYNINSEYQINITKEADTNYTTRTNLFPTLSKKELLYLLYILNKENIINIDNISNININNILNNNKVTYVTYIKMNWNEEQKFNRKIFNYIFDNINIEED